jgi:hypothetical protein
MSETQIQALANAAKSNSSLAERLNVTADFEAFLAIAKEAGLMTVHGWWYIPVKAGIERKDINEAAKGTGL